MHLIPRDSQSMQYSRVAFLIVMFPAVNDYNLNILENIIRNTQNSCPSCAKTEKMAYIKK